MALTDIGYGSIATSKILNDNFHYLDDKICAYYERIDTVNGNLTSLINSQINTLKNSLNTNIETSKTDITSSITSSLDATKSELEGKIEVLSSKTYTPDYSKGVSISTNYTVTKPSMVLWFKYNGGLWWGTYFWINGIEFGCGGNTYGDRASGSSVTAYVDKGDVITFSSGTVKIFPLKGVE